MACYCFADIQFAWKVEGHFTVVSQVNGDPFFKLFVIPCRFDESGGRSCFIGAFLVFCKVRQTGRSRCACSDVVLICLCILFSKVFQQCVAVARDCYCIFLLFCFTIFQLVVIALIVIGGLSAGVYRILSWCFAFFICIKRCIFLEIVEVVCGRRHEMRICSYSC